MEKLIRDGKVAVIYSPSFGDGWVSSGKPEQAVFDPELAEAIEKRDFKLVYTIAHTKYEAQPCEMPELRVVWIPAGVRFRIEEYNGAESIMLETDDNFPYTA